MVQLLVSMRALGLVITMYQVPYEFKHHIQQHHHHHRRPRFTINSRGQILWLSVAL